MFRRNADAAEQRRAKQAIVDIFTPNNARYLETRTQRNLIAKVKEGLVLRRQQQQPVIRNIYVVGAGTFLGASGQRGPPPMNLSAARTANINRLIVALDMANWIGECLLPSIFLLSLRDLVIVNTPARRRSSEGQDRPTASLGEDGRAWSRATRTKLLACRQSHALPNNRTKPQVRRCRPYCLDIPRCFCV